MNKECSILISVVLPVYNGGEYLKLSVSSVLQQDLQNFELIMLDDCSTDGSFEWLEDLEDKRIRLMRNDINRGLFYNLNKMISISEGALIKLWAQDDIMYPICLSAIVNFHQRHPDLGFSYSARHIIDSAGKPLVDSRVDNTPEIVSRELHSKIAYHTGSIAGNIIYR